MNSQLNNSFPFFIFPDRSETSLLDERTNPNSNSFVINFNKITDLNDVQTNLEYIEPTIPQESNINLNLSSKKKNPLEDFSYSIDQPFNERSLMTIEEEYRLCSNKENYFDSDDQNQRIDPIQEVTFEQGTNDSFIHENNLLFHNLNDSFDCTDLKSDNIDDSDITRLRRVLTSAKLSKSTIVYANSSTNTSSFKAKSKQLFTTSIDMCNNSYHKLNVSSGGMYRKSKKGRKKRLLDGIKTEIVDKAFIREFKKYLKGKRMQYMSVFEEDSLFWNEFFQNGVPPFWFTNSFGEKVEYKSFSRNLLRMIFGKASVRYLYGMFIVERGKDIMKSILMKKNKSRIMSKKEIMFYKLYGMNMHKLYCDDYSIDDILGDDVEMTFDGDVNLSL